MKAYYLLALLGAALVTGCAYEPVYTTPAPVTTITPAPAYVVPSNTVVVPSATVIR